MSSGKLFAGGSGILNRTQWKDAPFTRGYDARKSVSRDRNYMAHAAGMWLRRTVNEVG
jgi:hypothetical protein